MIARSLFYWAQIFSKQIVEGEQYNKLRRTIVLNFLDFNLFKDDRFWHKLHITDDESHEIVIDKLEMQFVELKKMKERENHSLLSFWVEFIRNPYSERCEKLYKEVPELKEAKEVFDAAKADPKKRALIEARANAILNLSSMIASARAEERAKAEDEKRESAKKFLQMGLSVDQVAQGIGLSIEEVEEIKKKDR